MAALDEEHHNLSSRVRQLRQEEAVTAPHVQSLLQASEDAQALQAEMSNTQAELRRLEAEAASARETVTSVRAERSEVEASVRHATTTWQSTPVDLTARDTRGHGCVQLTKLREERAHVDEEVIRAKAQLHALASDVDSMQEEYRQREHALQQVALVGKHVDDFDRVRTKLDDEVRLSLVAEDLPPPPLSTWSDTQASTLPFVRLFALHSWSVSILT